MSIGHQAILEDNFSLLKEILNITEPFLTALHGEGVLDLSSKQEIWSGNTPCEINQRFMKYLKQSSPDAFQTFLKKLREFDQQHIANLLDGSKGELPLKESVKKQIRCNIRSLLNLIDVSSGIVDCLYSKKAISDRDRQIIAAEKVTEDKVAKLFDVILMRSDRTFACFIEALKETNQEHVATALIEGKIIELHIVSRLFPEHSIGAGLPCILDEFEDHVKCMLDAISINLPLYAPEEPKREEMVQFIKDKLQEVFHKNMACFGCVKGQSITIYVLCKNTEAMVELLLMFETRQLEKILEEIFQLIKLSHPVAALTVRVTMAPDDLLFLRSIQATCSLNVKTCFTQTALHFLPKEFCNTTKESELQEADIEKMVDKFGIRDTGPEMEILAEKNENTLLEAKLRSFDESENAKLKRMLRLAEVEKSSLKEQLLSMDMKCKDLEENNKELVLKLISDCEKEEQKRNTASLSWTTLDIKDDIVFGVTYLNNCIYLLSTQCVLAFQSHAPYQRNVSDDIKCYEIKEPFDIAACCKRNCLYISDASNLCVWQITVDDGIIRKWLLDVGEPFTLSVTNDGCVLLPQLKPNPCLKVYNRHAEVMKYFPLSDEVEYPLHAVKTPSGSYIVSYLEDIMHPSGIVELSEDGKVIYRSVYEVVGDESSIYLAAWYDNWVFVARKCDHTISVFEKKFSCNILTADKENICCPSKLCFIKGIKEHRSQLVFIHKHLDKAEVCVCILPQGYCCELTDWV